MGDESLILILRSSSMTAGKLSRKPATLFGSYDWGTGDWMETWKQDAEAGVLTLLRLLSTLSPR